MFLGLFFNLLTGIAWTGVAVSLTAARRAKCAVEHFYIIGSLCAVALTLIWQLCTREFPTSWSWFVCGCMVFGATLNALSNTCTMLALGGKGAAALYFSISRMGFSISFLVSVLAWGEPAKWYNFLGIGLLITAVFLTAFAKHGGSLSQTRVWDKRLLLALGSTCCAGFSQACIVFPFSKTFEGQNLPNLPPLTRSCLIYLTNIVLFSIVTLCRQTPNLAGRQTLLKHSVIWGLLAVMSYAALFAALSCYGPLNRSGIAFPIGGAIQIFAFALFTRFYWKEKLNRLQTTALILIILGIFAVRI